LKIDKVRLAVVANQDVFVLMQIDVGDVSAVDASQGPPQLGEKEPINQFIRAQRVTRDKVVRDRVGESFPSDANVS
jgi:hypothetical protein